ncbi:protein SOB FIVE-LIKE 3-like [Dioscorea cayenensis subsp. rotundata]|uniref:Protein SOB FIVE-LIKE 3-like n=1 Tax=Dioscorea cayennensis subsp. rotundata TaxID=55577 RepID=A0AB40BY45_DIOCR|nr:protein SOB FIVE-LIKE 3-like [Dioscorea cayenensis subsp. rotundata]
MDLSQVIEDGEECSSSESGWTKYILPHMSDDDEDDSNESEDEGDKNGSYSGGGGDDDDDDDDDDSMASDASTGPEQNKHYDEKDDTKMIKDDNIKGSLSSCLKISNNEKEKEKEKERDIKRNSVVSLRR